MFKEEHITFGNPFESFSIFNFLEIPETLFFENLETCSRFEIYEKFVELFFDFKLFLLFSSFI